MCGIAGVISTSSEKDCMASTLETMQSHIFHRGPDSHGIYYSPSKQAALAHTRLAIIDLSNIATQPMSDNNQRYTITFNGEIYNYQVLRKKLVSLGYTFNSNSDTEVILNLYAEYGASCVNYLRGMFAFLIWDEHSKTAFAARDPLGIKPFYFWYNRFCFAFASELKALTASGLSKQQLDSNSIFSYLKTGSVSEPNTLISDISLLDAGHYLHWENGQINKHQYWDINFSNKKTITHSDAIKKTRKALDESIKAHLVSDVPVGLFLSGGIDSTALLALASKNTTRQINTYSIAFEEAAWNEGDIARRVAKHFGSNHTECVMTKERATQLYKEYCLAIDQPSIDGFNTFCVSKLAHDHGEKVVLSGLGGDELFAGYKSFKLLPKMIRLSHLSKPFAPIIRLKSKSLNPFLSTKLRRIFDFLNEPGSLTAAHQSLRGVFSNTEAIALTSNICNAKITTKSNIETLASTDISNSISKLELSTYMRNQLLRDSDVMSMHWGLELRVPLIDSNLIDDIADIPSGIRLSQGKKLLIDSVPEIPDWVYKRPKQGFRFPFDLWFKQHWQQSEIDPKLNKWIKLTPWYRQWSLVMLTLWIKRHAK